MIRNRRTIRALLWLVASIAALYTMGCPAPPPPNPCEGISCKAEQRCEAGKCVADCKAPKVACGDACVNLLENESHCGACGKSCEKDQLCQGGQCTLSCEDDKTLCGGSCVNTDNNADHCGVCGNRCQTGEACEAGACVVQCADAKTKCGRSCIDTQSSNDHCGKCDTQCRDGQTCKAGKCTTTCPKGQSLCGDKCFDLQTAVSHCGTCDTACQAGELCTKGKCQLSCPAELLECKNLCVAPNTDPENCGACDNKCKAGEVCAKGKCEIICPSGQTSCGGGCFDLQASTQHCGKCGGNCEAGEICKAGKCTLSCTTGRTACNGECVDTQEESAHCGGCNKRCPNNQACSKGLCAVACSEELTNCNGSCVKVNTDNNNCGTCGTKCAKPKSCQAGACLCPTGQTDCSGTCQDLKRDAKNCGACGNVCGAGSTCCGGSCVKLQSDEKHCGRCGNACGTGAYCTSATCFQAWAQGYGTKDFDVVQALALDPQGNVLITGGFQGAVKFGQTTLTTQNVDAFIVKLKPDGTVIWALKAGGTEADEGTAITTDSAGNVYVAGYFRRSATFGSLPALTSKGKRDLFVTKISAAGAFLWAKAGGGTDEVETKGIGVDNVGGVYLNARFKGKVTFGTLTPMTSAGSYDQCILKLNASGIFQWQKHISNANTVFASDVTTDATGSIYVAGYFKGTIKVDTVTLNSGSAYDIYIAKLSATGAVTWAKSYGGAGDQGVLGIAVDTSGNVHLSGIYAGGSATFGTHALPTATSGADGLIVKLNPTGTPLWAKSINSTGRAYVAKIAVGTKGDVYTTGYIKGTSTFGKTSNNLKLTAVGGDDIFIAKLSAAGAFVWVKTPKGNTNNEQGLDIAVDAKENYYIGGFFHDTISFDNIALKATGGDMFVVKNLPR